MIRARSCRRDERPARRAHHRRGRCDRDGDGALAELFRLAALDAARDGDEPLPRGDA
jgi:hypothetical protein